VATASWLAASPAYVGLPGQVNQLLASHTSQWVYGGSLVSQEATGDAVYQSTETVYLAQLILTGASQTAIGRLGLQISTVGGSPTTATIPPLTVGLYASQFGLPSGAPLGAVQLAEPAVYTSGFWVSVPLAASGLTASTPYWVVVALAGSAGAYYVWQQSNVGAGGASAPDGVTWAAGPYGFMYQVYDATGGGNLLSMVDDGGARTVTFTYSGATLTGITEYTQTQAGGTLVSSRTLTYSNGILIGVN
jgi:hypothetical protein